MSPKAHVTFETDGMRNGMVLDFVQAIFRQHITTGEDLHGNSSPAEQQTSVSGRIDEVGASLSVLNYAPVGKVTETIAGLVRGVVDNNENVELERMLTAKEVEKTRQFCQL